MLNQFQPTLSQIREDRILEFDSMFTSVLAGKLFQWLIAAMISNDIAEDPDISTSSSIIEQLEINVDITIR